MRRPNFRRAAGRGGVSGGVFTPKALSGLVLWLRGDLGITLNGSTVSAWADQSGQGQNLVQATGANQPTFSAADVTYNNRPLISSAATTQFLVGSAGYATSQPHTAIVVGECQTANGTFFAAGDSSNSGWLFLNNTSLKIFASLTLTDAVSVATPKVMMGIFNGAASFVGASDWISGGTSGDAGATGTVRWATGAYTDGLFGAVNKIAEIIVYSKVVSAAEKATLAAYLTNRYALAIT